MLDSVALLRQRLRPGDHPPNGWAFSYSGDRYRAADGELYENFGIPPNIESELRADLLDEGIDSMLEAALDALSP